MVDRDRITDFSSVFCVHVQDRGVSKCSPESEGRSGVKGVLIWTTTDTKKGLTTSGPPKTEGVRQITNRHGVSDPVPVLRRTTFRVAPLRCRTADVPVEARAPKDERSSWSVTVEVCRDL